MSVTTKQVLGVSDIRHCRLKRVRTKDARPYHVLREDIGITTKTPRGPKKEFREIKLPGLTKRMATSFFPGYRFSKAQGHGSGRGRTLGVHVDAQVTDYVNHPTKRKAMHRKLHFLSSAVLDAFRVEKLRPVKAQVAAYDRMSGIATSVDVLAEIVETEEEVFGRRKRARKAGTKTDAKADTPRATPCSHAVIELKVGFDTYADKPGSGSEKRMKHPFASVPNCPQNQHILQAAIGAEIVRRACARDGVRVAPRAYVFRACGGSPVDASVCVYRRPEWLDGVIPEAMRVLAQRT